MGRWRKGPVLAGLAVVAVGVGYQRLRPMPIDADEAVPWAFVDVRTVPERVAAGRHLVEHVLACGACHGSDLGGMEVPYPVPGGPTWAPNLTAGAGGLGASYEADDWERAVRHGWGADGRALRGMPWLRWKGLSDDDLSDVIAWMRSAPPVTREGPRETSGLSSRLARVLTPSAGLGDGLSASPTDWGPSAAYGAYLADLAGCHDCHGRDLAGTWRYVGPPGGEPLREDGWDGVAFGAAVRQGIGKDGRALSKAMPWKEFSGLRDTELDALWQYVHRASDQGEEIAGDDALSSVEP